MRHPLPDCRRVLLGIPRCRGVAGVTAWAGNDKGASCARREAAWFCDRLFPASPNFSHHKFITWSEEQPPEEALHTASEVKLAPAPGLSLRPAYRLWIVLSHPRTFGGRLMQRL